MKLALHLVLFVATCFTTTMQGALMQASVDTVKTGHAMAWALAHLSLGLAFSVPLMSILLVHEMGHYVVARLHRVPASLPYFIPVPPPFGLGTLGAVIGMRPSRDRNHIMDIGAAGPLAGLCVAVPVIIYGLAHSPVGPIAPGSEFEGNSLLYMLLKRAVTGHWLPGHGLDVTLSPMAMAGWFGLFVTMLNLLPIGQLDGGHVATGYFGGDRYERISALLHRALPLWALANFTYVTWDARTAEHAAWGRATQAGVGVAIAPLVWYGMLLVLRRLGGGRYHPPLDNQAPLTRGRRVLFGVTTLVFALIFMPWPFRAAAQPTETTTLLRRNRVQTGPAVGSTEASSEVARALAWLIHTGAVRRFRAGDPSGPKAAGLANPMKSSDPTPSGKKG
jgi:membrane-associated protease RseP (regulator of RpoE activity)